MSATSTSTSAAPSNVTLTANAAQQSAKDILDFIDDLRSLKIAKNIDLPQMVICGDQSAGKSSLLHSLTGIEFPVSDDVCTRFATILQLRDTPLPQYRASILPSLDAGPDEVERLQQFRPQVDGKADIENVIESAKVFLGVKDKGFSPHQLYLEISGPKNMNLTLVDPPGLFNSSNSKQSAADKERVRNIVLYHISRPRTIIVYVTACHLSSAQQNLGDEIKLHDPTGERTFCVFTKPDVLDPDNQPTLADMCVNLLKEQKPYSYHVVKNRAFVELAMTASDREKAEKDFLAKKKWARCLAQVQRHSSPTVPTRVAQRTTHGQGTARGRGRPQFGSPGQGTRTIASTTCTFSGHPGDTVQRHQDLPGYCGGLSQWLLLR